MQDHLARVGGEVLEEEPLGSAQLHELAVAAHHPAFQVDLDVADMKDAARGRDAGCTSEDGAHACRELIGMERLGDVVVRAKVEPLRLVRGGALGGEQDHRDRPPLPQLAHDLDPVEIGHHHVEEDDVGSHLLGLAERLLAAVGGDDAEPLIAQAHCDELGDAGFVIGDEDERLVVHRLLTWVGSSMAHGPSLTR